MLKPLEATILVVDDDNDNLEIISSFLQNSEGDYTVYQANNGAIALDIVEEENPDLILLDWMMPVMDGMETIKNLKGNDKTADIPVIMQTGASEDKELKTAFEAGALDYIKKPIGELELLARVKSALMLNKAHRETEKLLLNILPQNIANELKENGKVKPKPYKQVAVIFTDFKGFTNITEKMAPEELITFLNDIFLAFDEIAEKCNVERIKTIGDAYMCVAGLKNEGGETNSLNAVKMALGIQEYMAKHKQAQIDKNEAYFECRVGIHTGDVVAGVVGKNKFAFDIWGDTVNTAARIESAGEVGKVNVSASTHEYVKNQYSCDYRGKLPAKNKGEIDMYFIK